MKVLYTLLFSIFTLSAVYSQLLSEYDLPQPYNYNAYPDSYEERAIYFGQQPYSWNGKTIVFNHGFNNTAETFLGTSDNMYKWAYEQGYRCVFVSTHQGESMWDDAAALNQAMEQIETRWQAGTYYYLGYSNGGKAIDIVMSVYDKKDWFVSAVTLGTPYKGTPLANIAQYPAISWVADLIGLGGALETSTTYYMESVRPLLDNHTNNRPDKFYHFGYTGYNQFWSNPFGTYVVMSVSGSVISAMGWGDNDGTTPYNGHYKSGSHIMQRKGVKYNHLNLTRNHRVWNAAETVFSGGNYNRIAAFEPKEKNIEFSDYQIVYPENNVLSVAQERESYEKIVLSEKQELESEEYRPEMVSFDKGLHKVALGQEKELAIFKDVKGKGFYFEKTDSELIIRNYDDTSMENSNISIELFSLKGKSSLAVSDKLLSFEFDAQENRFVAKTDGLEEGVYALKIRVENEMYARDMISGFVLGEISLKDKIQKAEQAVYASTGNVQVLSLSDTRSRISISDKVETAVSLNVYDVNGNVVLSKQFAHSHSLDFDLPKGMYIVNVTYNHQTVSKKHLK